MELYRESDVFKIQYFVSFEMHWTSQSLILHILVWYVQFWRRSLLRIRYMGLRIWTHCQKVNIAATRRSKNLNRRHFVFKLSKKISALNPEKEAMKNVVLDIAQPRCLHNFDTEDSRITLSAFSFLLERGFCDCGRCNCTENWSGPSCSCSTSLEGCTKDEVRLNLSFADHLITLRSFGVRTSSQLFLFHNANLPSSYITVLESAPGTLV